MSREFEQRFLKTCELRAFDEPTDEDDDNFSIQGYAATFGVESTDDGLGFREMVMPGAFARSIRERADVKALFNHDVNRPLGRVGNGTLTLREDSTGLHFRVKLDRTNPDHRSVCALIKRGDVSECSFGFMAKQQDWSDKTDADGNLYPLRKLHSVDLMDVSAVVYPAYPNTMVRSAQNFFPNGVPAEIRSRVPIIGAKNDEGTARARGARKLNSFLL